VIKYLFAFVSRLLFALLSPITAFIVLKNHRTILK
jgi:hypothetical protein